MNYPYFSLVMPAYNCEDTISSTIESILHQTYKDFELIIINDGSTDGTVLAIQQYLDKDSRIKLFTIENSGPGNARNEGINKARGKYLCLIDADDKLEETNLDKRVQLLIKSRADLIIGSYETNVLNNETVVDRKQSLAPDLILDSKSAFLDQIYPLMDKQLMYVIWNKVYRLDIIQQNGILFPPYKSCEDRIFNLQYFEHVNNCLVTSEILYHYSFDGKNSLTNKYLPNKFDTFKEFYLRAVRLVPKDKAGFSALFLKGTMSCFIPLHSETCSLTLSKKASYIKQVLRDEQVQLAASLSVTDGLFKKIMKFLFKIPSMTLHYMVSWCLYKLSMMNPKTIEKLKGSF